MSSITRWKSAERGTEINAYSRTHSTHVLMVLESDHAVPSAAQWLGYSAHPSVHPVWSERHARKHRPCGVRLRACVQVRACLHACLRACANDACVRACANDACMHARCVRACQVACEGARYVRARVRAQMMRACVRVRECVRVSACMRVRACVRACALLSAIGARACALAWVVLRVHQRAPLRLVRGGERLRHACG